MVNYQKRVTVMNSHPFEHKLHDFVEHIKVNWAENVILFIIFAALLFLVLTTSVTHQG
jgi:hypothetical protein